MHDVQPPRPKISDPAHRTPRLQPERDGCNELVGCVVMAESNRSTPPQTSLFLRNRADAHRASTDTDRCASSGAVYANPRETPEQSRAKGSLTEQEWRKRRTVRDQVKRAAWVENPLDNSLCSPQNMAALPRQFPIGQKSSRRKCFSIDW